MRLAPPALAVLLALPALGGCSAVRLSGTLPAADPDVSAPAPPLEEGWSYDAEAAFGPAPVVVRGDVLLFGTRQGELHALEAGDRPGSMGRVELGDAIEGRPATDGAFAYVPVATGRRGVKAYDLKRGRTEWSRKIGPHLAGLVLDEERGVLVAASHDGVLRGLDPATGDTRWRFDPDSTFGPTIGGRSYRSTPALLPGGRVAAVDDEGTLIALDVETGRLAWHRGLGAAVTADLSASQNALFVSTTDGRLTAISPEGEELWAYATTATVKLTSAASHGELVAVAGTDGVLRALDRTSGHVRWTYEIDGAFTGAPAIADAPGGPLVFVGGMDKRAVALRAGSGEVVWESELEGRVKTAPVVVPAGVVFFREAAEVVLYRTAPVAANQAREERNED